MWSDIAHTWLNAEANEACEPSVDSDAPARVSISASSLAYSSVAYCANSCRGWTICMQLMGVGDKWMLYLPSEYAYGDAGRSDQRRGQYIPGGAVLIFELELLKVGAPSKPRPKRPAGMPNRPAQPTKVAEPAVDIMDAARPPVAEPAAPAQPPSPPPQPPPPKAASDGEPSDAGVKVETKAPPRAEEASNAFDDGVDTTLEAVSTLLNKLSLPTLQQALGDLGLSTVGSKADLSERITNALQPA